MTKQLTPRTFSPISTKISPSENVVTSALPGGTSTQRQIASASGRFAFPEKIVSALIIYTFSCPCAVRSPVGAVGFELRMGDPKSPDLPLVDAPKVLCEKGPHVSPGGTTVK